jgi:hypothetical protein
LSPSKLHFQNTDQSLSFPFLNTQSMYFHGRPLPEIYLPSQQHKQKSASCASRKEGSWSYKPRGWQITRGTC